jgi:hypothetical protein
MAVDACSPCASYKHTKQLLNVSGRCKRVHSQQLDHTNTFLPDATGALALVPQEQHILEALQLLAERNGEDRPDGTYSTDWPDHPGAHFLPWGHPLMHLEEGIRYGCK